MGVTISLLTQQLNTLNQDQADFKKNMKERQQVHQQQEKLKQVIVEAGETVQGQGKEHSPENAMLAFVEAMNQLMDGNLETMGAQAEHMQAVLDPQLTGIDAQLTALSKEQDSLPQDAAQNGLTQGQEVNAQMQMLDQKLDAFGVDANQDSMYINSTAEQNNAQSANAGFALDLVAKARRVVN